MDKIKELLDNNHALINDISSHPVLVNELLGVVRNIENVIPKECRENFYNNLEVLRIVPGQQSIYSLTAPIVCLDKKLLWLADNDIIGANYDYKKILVEELYHELVHMASTRYIVDLAEEKVTGYSGFTLEFGDLLTSNNLFNGLTEGFTQYLTAINTGVNEANYDIQISCAKKLIDLVGLDTVKQCYFNNKLGMQPILNKLSEKGLDDSYLYELENMCHVDLITHLAPTESSLELSSKTR